MDNNVKIMKLEEFNTCFNEKGIDLKYCGTEICSPSFSMEPHIRHEYLVHYIISGSGTYVTNNKSYELKPGSIFIIYPDTLVSYKTNSWDPFHFSWFSFIGDYGDEISNELGFSRDNCVQRINSNLAIHEEIEKCINLINENNKANRYSITSTLFEIFSLIIRSKNDNRRIIHNIKEEHVEKAVSYIKMHYMLPITVEDVTNFISLDRTYFSKIFRQCKKVTIRDYILNTRIEQAKTLLERTNYSSKEIASFVGFNDKCYFSRIFKKTTGFTPQEYREDYFKKEEA